NERPVYALAIVSGGESIKFGTSLTDSEKDAMLAIINQHLGYRKSETIADANGGFVEETAAAEELHPEDLSPATLVTVVHQRADEMVISYPLVPSSTFNVVTRAALAITALFAGGAIVFVIVAKLNAI